MSLLLFFRQPIIYYDGAWLVTAHPDIKKMEETFVLVVSVYPELYQTSHSQKHRVEILLFCSCNFFFHLPHKRFSPAPCLHFSVILQNQKNRSGWRKKQQLKNSTFTPLFAIISSTSCHSLTRVNHTHIETRQATLSLCLLSHHIAHQQEVILWVLWEWLDVRTTCFFPKLNKGGQQVLLNISSDRLLPSVTPRSFDLTQLPAAEPRVSVCLCLS